MTTPCGPTDPPADIDIPALREKYAAERAKRLRPDGADQYLELEDDLAEFYEVDPYTTVVERDPVVEDVDVVILGGGFAGHHLRAEQGIDPMQVMTGQRFQLFLPGLIEHGDDQLFFVQAKRHTAIGDAFASGDSPSRENCLLPNVFVIA